MRRLCVPDKLAVLSLQQTELEADRLTSQLSKVDCPWNRTKPVAAR